MKDACIEVAIRSDEENAVVVLKIDGRQVGESAAMPIPMAKTVAADLAALVSDQVKRHLADAHAVIRQELSHDR